MTWEIAVTSEAYENIWPRIQRMLGPEILKEYVLRSSTTLSPTGRYHTTSLHNEIWGIHLTDRGYSWLKLHHPEIQGVRL